MFTNIIGSTDSKLPFHLALTFGLAADPISGLACMADFVEATAAAAGLSDPALQMTVGVSDGRRRYAARYASGARSTPCTSAKTPISVRMLYPENERLAHFSDDARVVFSEPLTELPGLWREPAPATALVIGDDVDERDFCPIPPGVGKTTLSNGVRVA